MQQPTLEKYAHHQAEDFLQDEYFQHWVISDDQEADAFWKAFVADYPHQKERVKEARKLAEGIHYKPHMLSQTRQDAILKSVYGASFKKRWASFMFQKRHMAVAASAAFLLLSTIFWWLYPDHHTYQTGYQETKAIILADGSRVMLNANTTIRVAIDPEENQPRQVWLEGEAYFQVTHMGDEKIGLRPELKKFVVHTDNFDIEVLGTIFNASSRKAKSEVLLKEGSVKVASQKIAQTQILEPGDQLALSEEDQAFQITKSEKVEEPAWRENYFIFQNTPLEEVAQEIENYYGLEVELADPVLKKKIFTAKVNRDSLSMLLEAMEVSFGVSISHQQNKIKIEY